MERTEYSRRKKVTKIGFLKLDTTAWAAILVMALAGGIAAYLYHFQDEEQKNPRSQSSEAGGDAESVTITQQTSMRLLGGAKPW